MKKKILLITFFCISITSLSQNEDTEKQLKSQNIDLLSGWKKGGVFSLNFSQVSLTNWAAGGQNSISANGLASMFAHYKKNISVLENFLDIAYGSIKQGLNSNWQKTDDKIDFTSKYGRNFSGKWYYAALLNFKTQLAPGYNYPNDSSKISDFLAPAYLIGAIGIDYRADTNFTVFLAPLTMKTTFVNDKILADAGSFGVEPAVYNTEGKLISQGKKLRKEFGGYLRLFYRKELMTNVLFQTKLDLFSNYLHHPQNIDVSWEMLLAFKINEYFSANLSTHLLYDDDIDIAIDSNSDGITDKRGPATQFKEVLAIGISYKF